MVLYDKLSCQFPEQFSSASFDHHKKNMKRNDAYVLFQSLSFKWVVVVASNKGNLKFNATNTM